MGTFDSYDDFDAMGLAALVQKGETTAEELLETAIERTERVNGHLNAVVLKHYELARESIATGLPEGPFHGVPFLLKDLHLLLEGTPTTYGSAFFKDNLADHDSTLVARYKEAGLVIFGKTNSPEFGAMPVTEPLLFGPTRNPWDLNRTPGGSSGGASAAVAAGVIPMANASDGGGSIRVPASCTGLVGLKPTRGRTPMGPDRGEGWAGQSISHAVTRSVRDSAALLDATTGPEPGSPYEAPHAENSFLSAVDQAPGVLRIAVVKEKWGPGNYDSAVDDALEQVITMLTDLGHQVEAAVPEFDQEAVAQASTIIVAANTALAVHLRAEQLGRDVTDTDIEPLTRFLISMSESISAEDYARAVLVNHQTGRTMGRFHQQFDVILAPTLSREPIPIGYLVEAPQDEYVDRLFKFMGDTSIYNQTGQPSISLPLCWSSNNLPIGMMFTAAFGNDALLFRLAAQLEKAHPWWDKRPPLHAGNG